MVTTSEGIQIGSASTTEGSDPTSQFKNRLVLSETEKWLLLGEITELKPVKGNKRIRLATIEGKGQGIVKCSQYSDIQCECAAYIVSDVVGLNLVPPTVIRNINGEQVSVQERIRSVRYLHEIDSEQFRDQLYMLWIFDHIIRSNDRQASNIIFQDDKLLSVDHEAAFFSMEKEEDYDMFLSFYGEDCPVNLQTIFQEYFAQPQRELQLRSDLSGLLKPEDIDKTVRRIWSIGNMIVRLGRINNPEEMII